MCTTGGLAIKIGAHRSRLNPGRHTASWALLPSCLNVAVWADRFQVQIGRSLSMVKMVAASAVLQHTSTYLCTISIAL
jgi:hypothetical protein